MIPNANNINNFNNQIKIQLTTDNKCVIQTLVESPIKSQTPQKEEFSINDMSLSKSDASIYNNNNSHNASKPIILNSNKKNSNNDFDSNSNLLISFSNISEVTKINNNDCSIMRNNSNKNNSILINKEKDLFNNNINNQITGDKNLTINNINNYNIENNEDNSIIINNNNDKKLNLNLKSDSSNFNINNIKTPLRHLNKNNDNNNINKTSNKKNAVNKKLFNAFNKNDLSEISCGTINLNLNLDDKSENYDKVNLVYSDKKSELSNISLNINSGEKSKLNKKNLPKKTKNINSSSNKKIMLNASKIAQCKKMKI